jgi:hypothetical protein
MGRGSERTGQHRRDERLSVARRARVLLIVMGFVPAVQAEDPSTPATKPATTGTPPARPPAKSAPVASKPTTASSTTTGTTKKTPAAAPPAAPEADDELLEFLGSVDGLEGLEK